MSIYVVVPTTTNGHYYYEYEVGTLEREREGKERDFFSNVFQKFASPLNVSTMSKVSKIE